MTTPRKDDNLDFLIDVVLPEEYGARGVFIVSGEKPADFCVVHSLVPRDLRRKGQKKNLSVSRSAHSSSRHVLDLKRLLKEVREREEKMICAAAAEEFISTVEEAPAVKQKIKISFPKINFNFKKWSEKFPRYGFNFSPALYRNLAGFVILCIVFVLPIKALTFYGSVAGNKEQIVNQGLLGFDQFKRGGERVSEANFAAALAEFQGARENFAAVENSLGQIGGIANRLVSALPVAGKFLEFGKDLSSLGENLSLAALDLTRGLTAFKNEQNWVARIGGLQNYIEAALPRLAAAEGVLSSLRNNLREPLTLERWEILNDAVRSIKEGLTGVKETAGLAADLLGKSGTKRYLVIFQNSNELRPTGGFMGSFALLDVSRGEVKNLEIPGGGTYDLKGQLRELVMAPEPMRLIANQWQFQDANWFPDFPASAKKMMWFYEHSGGPTVDGVIAINSSLVQRLLGLTGPIEMPEYGKTITAENFMAETQKYVELEYDKEENKPKQIIADMAPKLIERLKLIGENDLGRFFNVLSGAVSAKDIQVYLADAAGEEKISKLGLDGALRAAGRSTDYLLVVDTNIAGQKTDGLIDELIDETIDVAPDGTIDKTLKITRSHRGVKGELFSGVRNVDYMRIYVPEGSILLSAEGFTAPSSSLFKAPTPGAKEDEDLKAIESEYFVDPLSGTRVGGEFGKTVFSNWVMVDPGRGVTVTIKYRLPYKFLAAEPQGILARASDILNSEKFFGYKEIVQKQSGAGNTYFRSKLNLPKNYTLLSGYPGDLGKKENGWQIETGLTGDKFFGILFKENN